MNLTSNNLAIFPDSSEILANIDFERFFQLCQTLISYSKGKPLSIEQINLLHKKLEHSLGDSRIYHGGSSVMFAWKFPLRDGKGMIMKPYYQISLSQAVLHIVAVRQFYEEFQRQEFLLEPIGPCIVIPMTIMGLARFFLDEVSIPAILQEESQGLRIEVFCAKEGVILPPKIGRICRKFAMKGYILDSFGSNWRMLRNEGKLELHYIDLMFLNNPVNVKEKIAEIIAPFLSEA